jgi:ligand-binding SRPBCC domain-containing protein
MIAEPTQRSGIEPMPTTPTIEFARDGEDYLLKTSVLITRSIDQVFPFFAAAENLARITPPELGFVIRTTVPVEMRVGALIDYTIKLWGVPLDWRTEITRWEPPYEFEDTQVRGPYAKWVHRHSFIPVGVETLMADEVRYRLPFGRFGRLAHVVVQRQLRRIFTYREQVIRSLLA